MLCSEKWPLWKSTCLVVWKTSEKENLTPHFLLSSNHLIQPFKISQYSFWQKTLNKAFPGSVVVIKDGYMLKCKKFNIVLYKITSPHVYQNMDIVLKRSLRGSWHLLGKKKNSALQKNWLSPSRGDFYSASFRPPKKQTRVKFDSAISSPVLQER